MRTARFMDVGKVEFADEPSLKTPADEVLIDVKASGICGTDYHIFEGSVKGLVEHGTVLGHEFAGEVVEIGSHVTTLKVGDRIAVEPNLYCGACHYCRNAKKHFCENWKAIGLSRDGGFAEQCLIPLQAAYKMPAGLSFEAAAFFEPMACVLHGIEQANVQVGETVVLQGAGSIGQLYIQALKKVGADKIIVAEVDDDKLKLAEKFGATTLVNVKNEKLSDVIDAETNGIGAQVMIDAAGLLSTIPTALEILENTGRVIIFGVPPEGKNVEISPYDIYRREIQILGSFTNPYTNEAALKMLKDVDINPILTNPITLDALVDQGFENFGKKGVLKIQVQF